MKKTFCIFLAAIFLCLSACGSKAVDGNGSTVPTSEPAATVTETETTATVPSSEPIVTTEPPVTTEVTEAAQLPLPQDSMEFSFLSGAGGWRTVLTLNSDGSFSGLFFDSEMGEVGEGYPHGSAYTCTFRGKFEIVEQLDAYSYKMTLTEISTEQEPGETWIEEDIRYVAATPHGLVDPMSSQQCTDFVFYLPNTPTDHVSEEFLTWWPYRYSQESEPMTTLSCYGILNVATGHGFFTA